MSNFKKFRTQDGSEIRVASTNGNVAIIGKEFITLPESLWGLAYAAGAISEDVKTESMQEFIASKKEEMQLQEEKDFQDIKDSLRSFAENPKSSESILDSNGRIVVRKAVQFIGKPIKKDIVEKAWAEVLEELEG